jgi:branched-chain amino acid transport system ATP-binding protein
VRDNLLTGAYSVPSRQVQRNTLEEIYELFPRVKERRSQLAGSLSGGEQQMVAIGRALMANPRLLMLDEPSLGIAPKVVAEIAAAIERINKEKRVSIVLVEQNARLALRLAHNAYALEHGEVVRSGRGDELLADPFVQKAYLGV